MAKDKDVALTAVKSNGIALPYFEAFLDDEEVVVIEAVKQDGKAIKYCSKRLMKRKIL